jgi:hypothetical protein
VTLDDASLTASGSLRAGWTQVTNPASGWASSAAVVLFDGNIFDGNIFDTGEPDWHQVTEPSSGWTRIR